MPKHLMEASMESAPNKLTPIRHQELIQYNDGQLALGFKEPGDELILGAGSDHKWGNVQSDALAIIETKSGNEYGVGNGFVISARDGRIWDLPEGDLEVTIGQRLDLFNIAKTSSVESIQLRYKMTNPGYGDVNIDIPNPFEKFDEAAWAFRSQTED